MHTIEHTEELKLGLESTLQDLPLWQVEIDLNFLGSDLVKPFKDDALLPGIILTENQEYVGMISRRRFFEHMSRPFSLELFLNRPIKRFLNIFHIGKEFVFSDTTSVMEATQIALQRSPELLYEPILVKSASGKHFLLDFHQLLLAYSRIHVLTFTNLQQAQEQIKIAETDLREFKQNQIKLLHNENIITLKQVVSGIASEINNPTNYLAGNLIHASRYIQHLLQLINLYQQHYPEPTAEIKTAINQIELDNLTNDLSKLLNLMKTGIDRIRQCVYSLRNFSTDASEKKAVDIHEMIDSTLLILQSRLKSNADRKSVTIIKEYGNLPLVECYPGQINLVFMNIISNAIDSLDKGVGTGKKNMENSSLSKNSSISKLFSPLPNPQIRITTQMAVPDHVIISIADNGYGMTEEVKQNIINPFFTTKTVDKGTGLGLSISYHIVGEKHSGQLYCNSEFGQGSEFIIKIPVLSKQ